MMKLEVCTKRRARARIAASMTLRVPPTLTASCMAFRFDQMLVLAATWNTQSTSSGMPS